MVKMYHLLLSVTFLIVVTNIAIIDGAMTYKQMEIAGRMMRESCQPQSGLNDEMVDKIKLGEFPDNEDLMCYVNCILELMVLIRDGVPNFEFVMKQMKRLLPEELREPYLNGLDACRNAADGIEGKCLIAYKLVECFEKNNPVFMFP